MTEDLLLKLEEKMMTLLAEVEDLRKATENLSSENATLKAEKEKFISERNHHERKLQDLLSLLESVNNVSHAHGNVVPVKSMFVQMDAQSTG